MTPVFTARALRALSSVHVHYPCSRAVCTGLASSIVGDVGANGRSCVGANIIKRHVRTSRSKFCIPLNSIAASLIVFHVDYFSLVLDVEEPEVVYDVVEKSIDRLVVEVEFLESSSKKITTRRREGGGVVVERKIKSRRIFNKNYCDLLTAITHTKILV